MGTTTPGEAPLAEPLPGLRVPGGARLPPQQLIPATAGVIQCVHPSLALPPPRFPRWDSEVQTSPAPGPSSTDARGQQSRGATPGPTPTVAFQQLALSGTPERNTTVSPGLPASLGRPCHRGSCWPSGPFPGNTPTPLFSQKTRPPERWWLLPPAPPQATRCHHLWPHGHSCGCAALKPDRRWGRWEGPGQGWCWSPPGGPPQPSGLNEA